jgi:hypothetical protein
MKEFVEGNRKVCFSTEAREETYGFIEGTLKSQQYRKSKGQKGIVHRVLVKGPLRQHWKHRRPHRGSVPFAPRR